MMAKLDTKIFDDKNWIYERKLDGYRALLAIPVKRPGLYQETILILA